MYFDIRGRRAGKTHDIMMAIGHDPHAAIVVPTVHMANLLRREYPHAVCRILPWSQRQALIGTWTNEVRIDNLDLIVQGEVGRSVTMATASVV